MGIVYKGSGIEIWPQKWKTLTVFIESYKIVNIWQCYMVSFTGAVSFNIVSKDFKGVYILVKNQMAM